MSTLIPENVEALALELAHREAHAAKLASGRAKAIADELEAAAGDKSISEYLLAFVNDEAGVRPPEGPAPQSAFWSFGHDHPEAPMNHKGEPFLDNRYIAEAWAHLQNEQRPGSAQTLETTAAGRRLNEMYLWEDEVLEELAQRDDEITWGFARECWAGLSETYAKAAEGQVVVFAQTGHTLSILHNTESPALQANHAVGLDNIHFAFEAPQWWPEAARDELGTNAVRAVAQFDNPSREGYIDPAVYEASAPEVREATLAKAMEHATPQQEAPAQEVPEQEAPQQEAAAQEVPAAEGPVPSAPAAEAPAPEAPAAEVPAAEGPVAEAETLEPEVPAAAPLEANTPPPPLWQAGFNPKPSRAAHGSSGPSAVNPEGPTVGAELASRAAGNGMDGPA
ncbi:hypothetical protein OHA27_03225 [Streptomyces sp. NBC_01619]|uniref:hypothetical protein n=1 Tax=Streptomyces sp. NBC_01619 TaxID=2975901 RepID=UPI0022563BCD|nr:hypothetical protein [Streptomyces sp. NBC_01619]MCX4509329.1 hypothetical protein [Streptomyces sp. NBC_01619]